MAATVTNAVPEYQLVAQGPFKCVLADVSFAASDYPTAGYALTPASFGLSDINGVYIVGVNETAKTVFPVFVYNVSTQKLQAFGAAGGATGLTEIANAGDLSATTVRLLVFGS